jgi:predicted O-linked N-acetylglucosamine transferase (SPINDLY family)
MNTNAQDLNRRLAAAVAAHESGDTAGAERLYNSVLAAAPGQPDALQLLGLLKAQGGRLAEAEALLRRALAAGGASAAIHFNLANVLNELGRLEPALAHYSEALHRDPGFVPAAIYRAVVLNQLGRAEEALAAFDALLARVPNAEAFYNRANILKSLGRTDDAIADYDRALALHPAFPEALFNRGNALLQERRWGDAVASYDRALAVAADYPEALVNRGVALLELSRTDEALASFDRALALVPDFADAHYNRGNALQRLFRLDEALASYDRALGLNPGYAGAANNLGSVLMTLKRMDEAIAAFSRALALQPDLADAHFNRAQALMQEARYEEAIADFERLAALGAAERYDYVAGDLLHARMHCCDWRDFDRSLADVVAAVRARARACVPFAFMAMADRSPDLLACAEIYAADKFPATAAAAPAPRRDGAAGEQRKIRLGYLGGEFNEQATAFLLAELIERHDRGCFEVIALDNGDDDGSPMRRRLEAAFDRMIDISRMTDDDAARAIRDLGIDILVNLNGYFGYGRTGIFARRPAPVQVNYLGFPGTLGAGYMDYIVADRVVLPEAEQSYYREHVAWLPDCYQPNDTQRAIAAATPPRRDLGLPEDGVVFCSFNNNYKLAPAVFDRWMRILQAVEGSVLWLLEGNRTVAQNLRAEAARRGVSPERIVFARRVPLAEHLARHRAADLFLDTLPYNAHTTGSDALWAGVPLLTCLGTTFPGRVAASLLTAMGLPELIARSLDEYEALAVAVAHDPARLAGLKATLAANRATAPLFDSERYRRHIEAAYATMWERCRAGQPPQSFCVAPTS